MIRKEAIFVAACLTPWLLVTAAQAVDDLVITVAPGSEFVAPGDTVTVTLDVANLSTAINGVQTFLVYDTALLTLTGITSNPAPGGAGWTEIDATDASGSITYIAVILGSSEATDHTVATLEFMALAEGMTTVAFLADDPPLINKLTDASDGAAITPAMIDSGTIVLTCDDGNACTTDAFVATACEYTSVTTGTPCGDPADSVCDNPDTCDGLGACQDNLEPATTACRAAAGDCDAAESCTGASADCPDDDFLPDTTECRMATGDCDAAEFCTGAGVDCPLDDVQPDTTECRPAIDDCDVAEFCNGMDTDCPTDGFLPDTTECRKATADCDQAEFCTGMDAACPTDGFLPDTTECRASAGECDVAEFCSGMDAMCPADGFAMMDTPCGDPAATPCDNPDACDGMGACLDNFEAPGASCEDGDPCNGAETCDGSGVCNPGAIVDCNKNMIDDPCDIDSGFSTDDNMNGIPDECEMALCPGGSFAECADTDDDGLRDDACLWYECIAGACAAQTRGAGQADMGGQFGACMIDQACDGNDRFQALNCFSGADPEGGPYLCEPAPPMALNVDAGGQFGSCVLDGVCDGNDAFAALNCFSGDYDCVCDAGPTPVRPPEIEPRVVARAALSLQPDMHTVHPGDVVEVDILLDNPLDDLRGYQLHIASSGGHNGALELIDILMHQPGVLSDTIRSRSRRRPPASAQWSAFNVNTHQILVGQDDPGHAVQPGYLATFVFRATRDANGTFVIDLLYDHTDPLHRTTLFPTRPGERIALHANPAVIHVSRKR